jgi:hypothetical protein
LKAERDAVNTSENTWRILCFDTVEKTFHTILQQLQLVDKDMDK